MHQRVSSGLLTFLLLFTKNLFKLQNCFLDKILFCASIDIDINLIDFIDSSLRYLKIYLDLAAVQWKLFI